VTRRALGIASAAYPLGVAVFAAYAAWLTASEHFRDLYADEWVVLAQRSGQSFPRWLITSHNGHLIPLTRFLLHADLEWLSGHGTLPVAVAILSTVATAALLWLPLRASGIEPASVRRTVGAFLALCLVYGGLCYGLLWGFSAHAPLMAAWLAVSLASLIAFAVEEPPRRRPWLLALAFVGAFGASLACATGVGAWAALLAVGIAARLPGRVLAAIGVGGAVCVLLVASAPFPRQGSQPLDVPVSPWLGHPVVVLRFVCRYLGTPLAWPAESWLGLSAAARVTAAFGAGAIGLAGYLAHVAWRIRAGRIADGAGLLGLALMTFGVAAAGVTAVGRAGTFQPVNHRFTLFAILFWMGAAVALAAPAGSARWFGSVQRSLVLLLPLASLLLLHSLGPRLDHHRERRAKITRHTLMLVVGIRNNGLFQVLANSRHLDSVRTALVPLEERGLGPFADPRRELLGAPLASAGIRAAVTACAGEIRERRSLGGRRRGESIDGVLRAETGRALPTSIVVADTGGTIQGLGNVLPPERSEAAWYAFRIPRGRGPVNIYAVFEDGTACVLEHGAIASSERALP
jgi:hypothetical protein